jgi:hypothetical protein
MGYKNLHSNIPERGYTKNFNIINEGVDTLN